MRVGQEAWQLPGLRKFLLEVRHRLDETGLAILRDIPAPSGLRAALARENLQTEPVRFEPGRLPVDLLAEALGTAPELSALLGTGLHGFIAIIDFAPMDAHDIRTWELFLGRFVRDWPSGRGLGLILRNAPEDLYPGTGHLDWRGFLGRGDRLIWAEQHMPQRQSDLAVDLAAHTAVELCGWRLDLASDLVRAPWSDIVDPLAWLDRSGAPSSTPASGADEGECPLVLRARGSSNSLQLRIWKAQLAAIFPWLEEKRVDLIARHRAKLRIDEHLRELRVQDVEEIELGALCHQLYSKLPRAEGEQLRAMARMRNALAHRKPVVPSDLVEPGGMMARG